MSITKEEAEASLIRFIIENNRYPTKQECREIEWLYSAQSYRRLLGNRKDITLLADFGEILKRSCLQCFKDISGSCAQNIFCGHSCAATYNNLRKPKTVDEKPFVFSTRKTKTLRVRLSSNCLHCQVELINTQNLYCSIKCQADYRFEISLKAWLDTGVAKGGNKSIRKYITHLDGYKCFCCGLSDWNNKPITLEVEHINGDSSDDSKENTCLICPNCHSQTDTYKGKNKGKGRHSRMQRYYDGKSY